MSKFEKTLARLELEPKDFKWSELQVVFNKFGFNEIQGNGSRVKFCEKSKGLVCNLHKPHPDPIMKQYAIRQVLDFLKDNGYI